jgi:hypothetical protein
MFFPSLLMAVIGFSGWDRSLGDVEESHL